MDGPDPVARWTKGTAARPYLDAPEPGKEDRFLATYSAALTEAHPPADEGTTLLPLRRLFMIAVV